jgi:acyl dehydratase
MSGQLSATVDRVASRGARIDPVPVHGSPYHGKWFEQLEIGLVVRHALTRTVTEADNVTFTTMTMNPARVHLDAEYASATEFGRPLVNSLFTLGLVVGISVLETTHGTTVANLGFDEVAFPAPVFCGDTIHVESEVVDTRPSRSRPEQGVVKFEHRAYNQRLELVCRARRTALMWREEPGLQLLRSAAVPT